MAALDPLAVTAAMIGPPSGPEADARREEMIGIFDCVRALSVHLTAHGVCTPTELAGLFSHLAQQNAQFSSHRALAPHLLADEMTQISHPEGRVLS